MKITDEIAKDIGENILGLHPIKQIDKLWCWKGSLAEEWPIYMKWLLSLKGMHVIESYLVNNNWNINLSYMAHTKEWVSSIRREYILGCGESPIKAEAFLLGVYRAVKDGNNE